MAANSPIPPSDGVAGVHSHKAANGWSLTAIAWTSTHTRPRSDALSLIDPGPHRFDGNGDSQGCELLRWLGRSFSRMTGCRKMYNPSATFTREELYAAVWSEPRTRLARKYGISDSGLTKICRRYRIPVPEPGHWQRLAAGKRTVQPPLPELTEEDLRYGLGAPIEICASPGSPARTESAEVEAAVARLGLNDAIAVNLRLSDPSPIVERTVKRLGRAKANDRGLVETDAPGAVTIAVSPDSIDREICARVVYSA